jgi:hypothetical protein
MNWAFILIFSCLAIAGEAISLHASAASKQQEEPFVIKINATCFYEAGRQHGHLAASRIGKFLADPSMQALIAFRNGNGRKFFEELVRINRAEFPDYAQEIHGIAVGAGVAEDDIWTSNLLGELTGASEYNMSSGLTSLDYLAALNSSSLMSDDGSLPIPRGREHCSTFLLQDKSGEIALAHNEDWSDTIANHVYLTDVIYPNGEQLWGFGYPGQILGFAIVINAHGIVVTQNSMWPTRIRAGFGVTFLGRRALKACTLDAALSAINVTGHAYGNTLNLMSLSEHTAANVEANEDKNYVTRLSEKEPYLYHFNNFVRAAHANAKVSNSTRGRTAMESQRAPPQSKAELRERLCYLGSGGKCTSHDCIYRKDTLLSWFFDAKPNDGGSPAAYIWHKASPCDAPPRFQWRASDGFSEVGPKSKLFLGIK